MVISIFQKINKLIIEQLNSNKYADIATYTHNFYEGDKHLKYKYCLKNLDQNLLDKVFEFLKSPENKSVEKEKEQVDKPVDTKLDFQSEIFKLTSDYLFGNKTLVSGTTLYKIIDMTYLKEYDAILISETTTSLHIKKNKTWYIKNSITHTIRICNKRYIKLKRKGLTRWISPKNFETTWLTKISAKAVYGDWVDYIKRDYSILIDNNDLVNAKIARKCNSIHDLYLLTLKTIPPKRILNLFSYYDVYLIYKYIGEKEISKITSYIKSATKLEVNYFEGRLKIKKILELYFIDTFKKNNSVENYDIYMINDYINLCVSNQEKINLNIKSYNRLEVEHNILQRKIRAKSIQELKVKNIYKNILESTDKYQIELIENKERLIKESELQNHCVWTYSHKINNGGCAIFSITTDKRYTFEISNRINDNHLEFFIVQSKAYSNKEAPEWLVDDVKEQLKNKKIHLENIEPIEEEKELMF